MTDRFSGFVVTLNQDTRDDDAEVIRSALQMVKGVLSVEPVMSNNFGEAMWRSRIYTSLTNAVQDTIGSVVYPDKKAK